MLPLARPVHVIFLRDGNDLAGLKHIIAEHAHGFKDNEGIQGEERISQFIEATLKTKNRVQLGRSEDGGIEVLYETNQKNYL